jgi:hypothetical protein
LKADFELVQDRNGKPSAWAKMLTFVTIFTRGVRDIHPARYRPADYPLVIIGTPIWGWRLVPSMRAYLLREAGHFDRVAFFCTEGGSGSEGAFREMQTLTGKLPLATLVVRQPDFKEKKVDQLVGDFVQKIHAALAH